MTATTYCPRCHRELPATPDAQGQMDCPYCGNRWRYLRPEQLAEQQATSASEPAVPAKPKGPAVARPLQPLKPDPNPTPPYEADLGLLDALAGSDTPADKPAAQKSPSSPQPMGRKVARKSSSYHRTRSRDADALLGKSLRGCEIKRKLGEGGMGAVYEAQQLSLERPVALKVLSPELRGDKAFIQRLEAEAKILARVNHPNLLHVYDFGEEPSLGVYFMIMEYVDGSDLTELLNRRRRLGQVETLEIIRQAALGLDAAAQLGIIHCDIKPDNLMLTRGGVCKVSDFGLATDIQAPSEDRPGTMRVGTPAFMSPEQCQGTSVDIRSDMYGLGCTAFVALTGHLPYQADSPFEIMLKHRTFPVPALRHEVPDLDPAVETFVQRLMAKKAHDRFASMKDLVDAAQALLENMGDQSGGNAKETQAIDFDMPDWLEG